MSKTVRALIPVARRPIAILFAVVAVGLAGAPMANAAIVAGPPVVGPATPGTPVCTVSNTNVDEVTGMVATDKGIYAVEGGDTFDPGSVVVWTINPTTCAVTSKNYGFDPADPQDLALGPDGALWVADIGDGIGSNNNRSRVTLERVDLASSAQAVPYRMFYPDSVKFNAQAMLLPKDGLPIIIANGSGGKATMYRPSAPLIANTEANLPKLVSVGEFTPVKTGTSNPLGNIGSALVTGAALAPNGSKVVIRTASDAYEFPVGADGDVVKAITEGTAVVTPLPSEENGQAITYSADSASFLTLSSATKPVLRSYKPFVPPAPTVVADQGTNQTSASGGGLSLSDINTIAVIFAVAGFVTIGVGFFGIWRARRQHRLNPQDEDEYGEGAGHYPGGPLPRQPGRRARSRGARRGDGGYGDGGYGDGGYGDGGQDGGRGDGGPDGRPRRERPVPGPVPGRPPLDRAPSGRAQVQVPLSEPIDPYGRHGAHDEWSDHDPGSPRPAGGAGGRPPRPRPSTSGQVYGQARPRDTDDSRPPEGDGYYNSDY